MATIDFEYSAQAVQIFFFLLALYEKSSLDILLNVSFLCSVEERKVASRNDMRVNKWQFEWTLIVE